MSKIKEKARVVSQEEISKGIFSIIIESPRIAQNACPGQFINVYSSDHANMLPRPISICEIGKDSLRLVYRTVGKGTLEFSKLKVNSTVDVVGPIGNGFPINEKKAILVGGGIGIPPMLELAKQHHGEFSVVAGYRTNDLFLKSDFDKIGPFFYATEDGTAGIKGNVLDVIATKKLEADVIYACGPRPMLKAIKEFADKNNIECWLSLEERMACGVGACLGCICKSTDIDHHSQVKNKRVCVDGPVFNAKDVCFD